MSVFSCMFFLNRHTEFEVSGVKHMRLLFYIEGPDSKGTVHVEAKQVVYSFISL